MTVFTRRVRLPKKKHVRLIRAGRRHRRRRRRRYRRDRFVTFVRSYYYYYYYYYYFVVITFRVRSSVVPARWPPPTYTYESIL